jgi:hypothetical protein
MTRPDLDAIQARADKATPDGPAAPYRDTVRCRRCILAVGIPETKRRALRASLPLTLLEQRYIAQLHRDGMTEEEIADETMLSLECIERVLDQPASRLRERAS